MPRTETVEIQVPRAWPLRKALARVNEELPSEGQVAKYFKIVVRFAGVRVLKNTVVFRYVKEVLTC